MRRIKTRCVTGWVLFMVTGLVTTGFEPQPATHAPALLRATGIERGAGTHTRADVVRHRVFDPNLNLLNRVRPGVGDRVTLNLFDDVNLVAEIRRKDFPGVAVNHPQSYSLSGPIVGDPGATFNLVVHRGVVAAAISLPGRTTYQIHALANGLHEVCQLDFNRHPGCETDAMIAEEPHPDLMEQERDRPPLPWNPVGVGDDGSVIDVMILYSEDARAIWGGMAATEAEILLAIDLANTALTDSNTGTSLRLVHTGEIAFVESGSLGLDLTRVVSDPDVRDLRNMVAADVVGMFVSNAMSCGRANLLTSLSPAPQQMAYNISVIGCAAQNRTFAHEMGHTLGCGHETTSSASLFADGHGHVEPGGVFRTVMATFDEAIPRVGHFSNPFVNYFGLPTGVLGVSDNARTIGITREIVAQYRTSGCPAPDCNDNCITDAVETGMQWTADCNANGVPDQCDVGPGGSSFDCDNNGLPDDCEDCDGNGLADACDIAAGADDCNNNGWLDDCEVRDFPDQRDCNGNGVPDDCDIDAGTSGDCVDIGTPDECDIASGRRSDCNNNGIPDFCDRASGTSLDCNNNFVPDECEDCDGNGIADECDLATPKSLVSPQLSPVIAGRELRHVFDVSSGLFGPVSIHFTALAHLDGHQRDLEVAFQVGTSVRALGSVFDDSDTGGCVVGNQEDSLTESLSSLQELADLLGVADLIVTPSALVVEPCNPNSWVQITLNYREPGDAPADCDLDGVLDLCELNDGSESDCNGNFVPDSCDVASGSSPDANNDGVPDECEDCNNNGVPDRIDVMPGGGSVDCNDNLIPDECEDCNSNGIGDSCEFVTMFVDDSPPISPFGAHGDPNAHHHDLASPPTPQSDVTFTLIANGLLDGTNKVMVRLNDTPIGEAFLTSGEDCPVESADTLVISAAEFLSYTGAGDAIIDLQTFDFLDTACGGNTWIAVSTSYAVADDTADTNGNMMLDECELARGDNDLDGIVGVNDFLNVLAEWGACPAPCPEDADLDGVVGILDFLTVLANWG